MKKQLFILLFFTLCFAQAQTPADKKTVLLDYRIDFAKPPRVYKYPVVVFLKDYETKQPITQANVTLEGYLLKDIKAKYNKKEGYFYFKKIPKGYNTIMAYAENYNPKGLQNTEKLPQEITLELHDPMNMVYSFQKKLYTDKEIEVFNKYVGENLKGNYRYNIYIEDPYKIVIDCPKRTLRLKGLNMELCSAKLDSMAKALDLVKVNTLNLATMNGNYKESHGSQKKLTMGVRQDTIVKVFQESNGLYKDEDFYEFKNQANVYRRKDNLPFKRFNCPILKAIRETKDFEAYPILYKKILYSETIPYTKSQLDALKLSYTKNDKKCGVLCFEINSLQDIDDKKVFLNLDVRSFRKFINNVFIIENESFPNRQKDYKILSEKIYHYKLNTIGLGILDTFEFYNNNFSDDNEETKDLRASDDIFYSIKRTIDNK